MIIGTMLVGTAVAAPLMMSGLPRAGYGMMRAVSGVPGYGRMLRLMEPYRTADGRFDMGRMMSDVTSGKVAAPCIPGSARAGAAARAPRQAAPRTYPGYGMMGRSGATGYGMMRRWY
jgi:hypothetical protein